MLPRDRSRRDRARPGSAPPDRPAVRDSRSRRPARHPGSLARDRLDGICSTGYAGIARPGSAGIGPVAGIEPLSRAQRGCGYSFAHDRASGRSDPRGNANPALRATLDARMHRFPNLSKEIVAAAGIRARDHAAPWELSPKREIDTGLILQHDADQLGRFFVALSLAYNDLKGMVLFERYLLAKGRPAANDWSPYAGQWRGTHVQIHRFVAGILHEVMVLIAKNEIVVESADMRKIVAQLGPKARAAWQSLVDSALGTNGDTSKLLLRIRNNAGFHYDAKALGEGYQRQFRINAAAAPTEGNLKAQYSYGPDMDGTRFFYADAAAQQLMMMIGVQYGGTKADDEVVALAKEMNDAIAPLIESFLSCRSNTASR